MSRNTRFYTGRGDSGVVSVGTTELGKDHPLFDVLGSLDELNSWLGLCRVEAQSFQRQQGGELHDVASAIKQIQELLFIAQSEMAAIGFSLPFKQRILEHHREFLEKIIDEIDETYPTLKQFVIPGGTELAARLDVARAMARNSERRMRKLASTMTISKELLPFLNRLSSALFALARYSNYAAGITEEHPSY